MAERERPILPSWGYHNPVRVKAGAGLVGLLRDHATGRRILLVTSKGFTARSLTATLIKEFGGRLHVYDQVDSNPDLDMLEKVICTLRGYKADQIIGIGGGSVLDTSKILSVAMPSRLVKPLTKLLRNNAVWEWKQKIPLIVVPTTSGTGAEVTPFATVWDNAGAMKYSLANDWLYPDLAILDPTLTVTLSRDWTLYPALDAISHALESLWNRNRTPLSEMYALHALRLILEALPLVLKYPRRLEPRARMQQAALLGGLAISQTRTAIAHSISYPLTLHHRVPHGLACGFCLTGIIDYLLESSVSIVSGRDQWIINRIKSLLIKLELGKELRRYVDESLVVSLVGEMTRTNRIDNFIGQMNKAELSDVLRQSAC